MNTNEMLKKCLPGLLLVCLVIPALSFLLLGVPLLAKSLGLVLLGILCVILNECSKKKEFLEFIPGMFALLVFGFVIGNLVEWISALAILSMLWLPLLVALCFIANFESKKPIVL